MSAVKQESCPPSNEVKKEEGVVNVQQDDIDLLKEALELDYWAEEKEDIIKKAEKKDGGGRKAAAAVKGGWRSLKRQRAANVVNGTVALVPDMNRKYQDSYPVSEEDFEGMKRGERQRQCPTCSQVFVTMGGMIKHFKKNLCSNYTRAPLGLEMHSTDPETGEDRYTCTFPGCYQSNQQVWKHRYEQ